ncbi:MAG: family transcriptional regulator [Glaciihabitans sp.]|nr:family transcriptional regulator [Glaciihabitans sp.]
MSIITEMPETGPLAVRRITPRTAPGKSLRPLRIMANLTLDEVAKRSGVSVSYLSRVETGVDHATAVWLGLVAGVIAKALANAA